MEDGGAAATAAAAADGNGEGQGKPAPKLMKVNIKADRRKLRSSNYWELIKVVVPFMVYSILVVSIYGSALSTLNQTTRPLRDLISAEKLLGEIWQKACKSFFHRYIWCTFVSKSFVKPLL